MHTLWKREITKSVDISGVNFGGALESNGPEVSENILTIGRWLEFMKEDFG